MLVKLGHLQKENNSTYKPSSAELETFDEYACVLKGACSVLSPVIVIDTDSIDVTYNYGVFTWVDSESNQTVKYYFVNDIVIDTGGRTTISFAEDVLATFRDDITSCSAYVARSSFDEWYSKYLKDDLITHDYSTYTDVTPIRHYYNLGQKVDTPISDSYQGGTILFTTAGYNYDTTSYGKIMGATGAVYACSVDAFCRLLAAANNKNSGLLNQLFGSGSGVSTDSQALACAFFNPSQYITNAIWMPFSLSMEASNHFAEHTNTYPIYASRTDTICVGGTSWTHQIVTGAYSDIGFCTSPNVTIDYYICKSDATTEEITEYRKKFGVYHEYFVPVSGWKYDEWIDRSEDWNQYSLYVPSIGMMTLPADMCGQPLKVHLVVDCLTGEAICQLIDGMGCIHAWQKGQMGITLQLNSLTTNIQSQLSYDNASATAKLTQMQGQAIVDYTQGTGQTSVLKSAGNTTGGLIGSLGSGNIGNMLGSAISGSTSLIATTMNANLKNDYQGQLANINNIEASNAVDLARATMLYDRMSPSLNVIGAYSSKSEVVNNNVPKMICKKKKRYADLTARLGRPVCKIKSLSELTHIEPQYEYVLLDDPIEAGVEYEHIMLGSDFRNHVGTAQVKPWMIGYPATSIEYGIQQYGGFMIDLSTTTNVDPVYGFGYSAMTGMDIWQLSVNKGDTYNITAICGDSVGVLLCYDSGYERIDPYLEETGSITQRTFQYTVQHDGAIFYTTANTVYPPEEHLDCVGRNSYRIQIYSVEANTRYKIRCHNGISQDSMCGAVLFEYYWDETQQDEMQKCVWCTPATSEGNYEIIHDMPSHSVEGSYFKLMVSSEKYNDIWVGKLQVYDYKNMNSHIYVKLADDNINIDCMQVEKEQLIAMTNGGFYYE